jgi:hypothetical protein
VGGGDFLDVPGGNDLAGRVLALAGFHLVAHQDTDGGLVACCLGANAHRICHFELLFSDSIGSTELRSVHQPPQPPSVTLTSFLANSTLPSP